jgi:HAD superfamily hydrolase (TIGR01549 family)
MSNRTRPIKTILFDWDGTLADTAHLGLVAFQKTFAELGVDFALGIYETAYSPNWYSTYEALGLPKEKWQRADELWLQHYGERTPQLIEGAAETLLNLHRRGYRLGVVSSGSELRVCREIGQSELASVFETIICNEHMINKKPDPEGLRTAIRRLDCIPADSAYVGDTPEDIEMGRRAGVLTVGVRSAYPSNEQLLDAKPDIYLGSLFELSNHF